MQENQTNQGEETITGDVSAEVSQVPVEQVAEGTAVSSEVAETALGEVTESLPAVEVVDATPLVVTPTE